MRRALAYVITAPLVLLGVLMAHQASYIAVAGHDDASLLLARTGHGYLAHAPLGIAVALAVVFAAIVFDGLRASLRATDGVELPLWPFAVAGPAAFFIQEHLERLLADGTIPWTASLEPTFILGILLQAPAAALTYAVATRLMRSAHRVAGTLVGRMVCHLRRCERAVVHLPRIWPRARRIAAAAMRFVAPGRAPPLPIFG